MDVTTLVVSDRVYELRVSPKDGARTRLVNLRLNSGFEWTLAIPVWGSLSWGAHGDLGYVWLARQLIVLPQVAGAPLEVEAFDEDLKYVFRAENGWLAVCETSVRRIVDKAETARIELADVVDTATLTGRALHICDFAGREVNLTVNGPRLTA